MAWSFVLNKTFCDRCKKEINGSMRLFKIGNEDYCLDCWEGKK